VLKHDKNKNIGQVVSRGGIANISNVPEEVLQTVFHSGWPINGKSILKACPECSWDMLKNFFMVLLDHGVITME